MNRAYLAPLGLLGEELLAAIEEGIRESFGLHIYRMHALAEPLYAFDFARRQYSAAQILKELVRHCPRGARILGVVEIDLYIPTLSFVFGQAQLDGCAAIVSLARLRQEFYQLPPNFSLLRARAKKESIHEMGHTFGLTHCPEAYCPMSISTSIQQVDLKGDTFCRTCTVLLSKRLPVSDRRPASH